MASLMHGFSRLRMRRFRSIQRRFSGFVVSLRDAGISISRSRIDSRKVVM